jgi:lipopolysaccharide biosynthesis protein
MSFDNFDAQEYLARYPEVEALGMDPWDHFQNFGKRLGYVTAAPKAKNTANGKNVSAIKQSTSLGARSDNVSIKSSDLGQKRRHKSVSIAPLRGGNYLFMTSVERENYSVWSSSDYDPQMVLFCIQNAGDSDETLSLTKGKYIFVIKLECISGAIKRPRIYLDYGSGYSEEIGSTYVAEFCDAFSEYFFSFQLNRSVVRIRFDPSEAFFEANVFSMSLETYETVQSDVPFPVAANSRLAYADGKPEPADVYRWVWDASYGAASGSWRHPEYAPLISGSVPALTDAPKAIAFYLPQYHPFEENNKWWGKGFTEWTNVSKAVPQFVGHYQPRLPGELGFYDLRLPEIMARQIELAKQFGVHGFCFHYYWFDAHRLLEKPIEAFLANKSEAYDFPFCLCWANENWTRRWDGSEDDVLMGQKHSEDDHHGIFQDLLRYFKDSRYIKVDNKPVILIYRAMIIEKLHKMVEIWQADAKKAGFDGVYLIATNSFGFEDPGSINFDGICEFPPHGLIVNPINDELNYLNNDHAGHVFENRAAIDFSLDRLSVIKKNGNGTSYFPGVMTGWDNEARKPGRGNVFHDSSPRDFYRWFSGALDFSMDTNAVGKKFVFINAWNEWAEGTYLEPDRKFGYGYLAAVSAGLRRYFVVPDDVVRFVSDYNANAPKKASDSVVTAHIFYLDLVEEIGTTLTEARVGAPLDLMITLPEAWSLEDIRFAVQVLKPNFVCLTKNVGRDVWPFIQVLKKVKAEGYQYGCKIHSKKSPHLNTGASWRRAFFKELLSASVVTAIPRHFMDDSSAGILAPRSSISNFEDPYTMQESRGEIIKLLGRYGLELSDKGEFVAGTMFWFRVAAMQPVLDMNWTEEDFGPELGAIDGAVAHAFERVLPLLTEQNGFKLRSYKDEERLNPYS